MQALSSKCKFRYLTAKLLDLSLLLVYTGFVIFFLWKVEKQTDQKMILAKA